MTEIKFYSVGLAAIPSVPGGDSHSQRMSAFTVAFDEVFVLLT